ncbi:putative nTP pyrophosphohydrolase [Mycobacterium avium subsp. avium 2285 (R)]|nr:putative nTP pyrophosphohydrolase [Mycobacterium avium subsp. avium 2285 (R)]
MTFIERLASREIYRNPWMVLREDDIRRPDGSAGIYSVVDKPSYALVMPYDGRRFGLVEQFRYPIGERRWEFPRAPLRSWPTPIPLSWPGVSCARKPDCAQRRSSRWAGSTWPRG